ncbi:hypothetical protein TWF703_008027 [Orbilia oligospora]|uniref:Uncharacterized protein n=1 Tax=Orbilia oligospora TaxID=2813651 RepID=A0A7C8NIG6_ORBOL|nr:hypothetical protein TWF703_008027 [Orbilia oligospora]
MAPAQPGNKLGGTSDNRPILENKDGGEYKNFAPGTKETPTDLAVGLRPRPHPAVPTAHGDFKGIPPPPPPPGDAPILNIEREVFKLPPKKPKDPNAPAKPLAKLNMPPQAAMLDELKQRLGKKVLRNFEEPKREPPRKSPTLLDEMKAEMPGKIAKLKPVGTIGNVSRMKEDIEKTKLREGEHKKASPTRASPWMEPAKPKEPVISTPVVESPKKPGADKMTSIPKPQGRLGAVTKLDQPVIEVQTRPVITRHHLEEPPQADPYILWPIRVLGLSLILLGLLKLEIYLWVISWNIHIWNQLDA